MTRDQRLRCDTVGDHERTNARVRQKHEYTHITHRLTQRPSHCATERRCELSSEGELSGKRGELGARELRTALFQLTFFVNSRPYRFLYILCTSIIFTAVHEYIYKKQKNNTLAVAEHSGARVAGAHAAKAQSR